jgi:hypothetical protein
MLKTSRGPGFARAAPSRPRDDSTRQRKYSAHPVDANPVLIIILYIPSQGEGRIAIARARGMGGGGRGSVRRGISGQGGHPQGSVRSVRKRWRRRCADGEDVWSRCPAWRQAPPESRAQPGAETSSVGCDGDETACRPPGRARNKPLTPPRAERRVDPGVTVAKPRVLSTIAHEPMGASGTRRSARPLHRGRSECSTPRARWRCGIASIWVVVRCKGALRCHSGARARQRERTRNPEMFIVPCRGSGFARALPSRPGTTSLAPLQCRANATAIFPLESFQGPVPNKNFGETSWPHPPSFACIPTTPC